MPNDHKKIRFSLDASDWHGRPSETLWAIPLKITENEGVFEVANIPFFVKGVSFKDTVAAKFDASSFDRDIYNFDRIERSSGHSTYMILYNGKSKPELWQNLQDIGCSYESKTIRVSGGEQTLLAVDGPPEADIYDVYHILEKGEGEGVWMFQEGKVGQDLTGG